MINGLVRRTWFLLGGLWSSLLGALKAEIDGTFSTEKTGFLMAGHEKGGKAPFFILLTKLAAMFENRPARTSGL